MVTKRKLLTVLQITDDSAGVHNVGELDFGVPLETNELLGERPGMREELATWLEWLALQCRTHKPPFGDA